MNMTPRNIIIMVVAVIIGLYLGLAYPLLGLLLLIPVIAYVVIILMRNKGGAVASPEAQAEARRFIAAEGKSRIYVMRKGFVAGQQGMNVTIDGGLNSQIRTGYFLCAEVEPGAHELRLRMNSQTESTAVTQAVTLAAGESVLFDAKLNMGALQGSIALNEIREGREASEKLSTLKLVEWK